MEILLLLAGIIFFVIGLVSLRKAGFSEQSQYSWRMGFFVGGIAWIGFYLLLRNHGAGLLGLYGSWVFSLACLAVGLIFLIWNSKVAAVFYKLQLPGLKFIYRDWVDWKNPWMLRFIRAGFIFAGIILVGIAWANYYGPR